MAFKPETLDGQAAAQRLLKKGTHPQHQCLNAVFWAFPFKRSDTGNYRQAIQQWERTPKSRRHPGDRDVPPGGIVLFSLAVPGLGRPGHICISLGGEKVVTTDWPTRGSIGTATISDIEKRWNAEYLGWTDVIGGHNVAVGEAPGAAARRKKAEQLAAEAAITYSTGMLVHAANGLRLRAARSTSSEVRAVLPHNLKVLASALRGEWYPVYSLSLGKRGFAHRDFLVRCDVKVNAKRGLNLRTHPRLIGSRVLVTIPNGTALTIIATAGAWRRVAHKGRTGWVHSRYVR